MSPTTKTETKKPKSKKKTKRKVLSAPTATADSVLALRATARGFVYVALSGTRQAPIVDDQAGREIPASYSLPNGLLFLEDEVASLVKRFRPGLVAVREADYSRFAMVESTRNRIRIEGGMLAACSRFATTAYILNWTQVWSSLGIPGNEKKTTMNSPQFRDLDWSELSSEARDALLAGLSVLA